jgi:hypothetical protein
VTIPAVTFTNPRTSLRALLDTALTPTVGTSFPTARPDGGYVQVAWDGTPATQYPATIDATIRVVAWHTDQPKAETLALQVLAALGSQAAGTASLWSVQHLTGPLPGADEASGFWFAYSTFRVRPKPAL